MTKKQKISIVGSIGDEINELHPLVEYIIKESGKKPEEFEIYSLTEDGENVKVYVYFDQRTWAMRYTVPKELTEGYKL